MGLETLRGRRWDSVHNARPGVNVLTAPYTQGGYMAEATDAPKLQTVSAFARAHAFDRVAAWRAATTVPGLAAHLTGPGHAPRGLWVVVDPQRLLAVLAARRVRGHRSGPNRQPPPGHAPAGEASDGVS